MLLSKLREQTFNNARYMKQFDEPQLDQGAWKMIRIRWMSISVFCNWRKGQREALSADAFDYHYNVTAIVHSRYTGEIVHLKMSLFFLTISMRELHPSIILLFRKLLCWPLICYSGIYSPRSLKLPNFLVNLVIISKCNLNAWNMHRRIHWQAFHIVWISCFGIAYKYSQIFLFMYKFNSIL